MRMTKTNFKSFIKTNGPTLLTLASVISVITTTALSIKAGMDVSGLCEEKKPDKKDLLKTCVPAFAFCAVSIGCALGADMLNRKQKSDLLAMCALAGSSYSSYRTEVIKRYGEEVDEDIIDTVSNSCCYHFMAPDIPDKKCHWILNLYDEHIPIYELDALERDIIHAEMHFNRNYILSGGQPVSSLLNFLGIELSKDEKELADYYGWLINDDEIYYVDFEHTKIDDTTFEIHPVFAPWADYENRDMCWNKLD